jgi:serine/threonine protein kinase
MHNKNIAHLDLKPSNLLIKQDGTILIGDFGCSVQKDFMKGGIGDITYFSPDRLRFVRSVYMAKGGKFMVKETEPMFSGHAADMYALGLMMLEFINGVHPIECSDTYGERLNSWSTASYQAVIPKALEILPNYIIFGPILKGLLKTDPKERSKASEAFKAMQAIYTPEDSTALFKEFEVALLAQPQTQATTSSVQTDLPQEEIYGKSDDSAYTTLTLIYSEPLTAHASKKKTIEALESVTYEEFSAEGGDQPHYEVLPGIGDRNLPPRRNFPANDNPANDDVAEYTLYPLSSTHTPLPDNDTVQYAVFDEVSSGR